MRRTESENFGHRTDLRFDLENGRQTDLEDAEILDLVSNLSESPDLQRMRFPESSDL